jgi:hypothetical protein
MDIQPTSHAWLSAFADRLMQLQPTMSTEQAVRRAVASIHEGAALDPWIAAEIFALAYSKRAPAAKARKLHTPEEPHAKRYRELFGIGTMASAEGSRA